MKNQNRVFEKGVLLGIVLFVLAACADKHEAPLPVISLPDTYRLTFQDEFNDEKLDTAIWGFHNPGRRRSAVNVEEACMVNQNGELEIRNWTRYQGNDTIHHAGMIETKEDFVFGYYESRIKFNIEMGSWGAFWIMYHNFRDSFGPEDNPKDDGVEIDIMEFVPTNGRYGCHNLHWNGYGEYHNPKAAGNSSTESWKVTTFTAFCGHPKSMFSTSMVRPPGRWKKLCPIPRNILS